MAKQSLVILGASARAAAASALRAGFTPWCADLFADADLERACLVQRVDMSNYPDGLIAAAAEAPPGPWMYTGALENRPDIVAGIDRVLWGNPQAVLQRIRSPRLVYECLTRRNLPCPQFAEADADPRGRWLLKPRRSAGGQGIRPWQPGTTFDAKRFYLQHWLDGESQSASFLAQSCGPTLLLGMTRQLIGEPELHAAPFQYCGSVGPIVPSAALLTTVADIGKVLADEFALRGLFGVDFVVQDGTPWPVEINPRYTASMEMLERATGHSLIALHAATFTGQITPNFSLSLGASAGKFILFARAALTFPAHGAWEQSLRDNLADPTLAFADIPHPGEPIAAGQPILTFFAPRDEMRQRVEELENELYGP